MPYFDWRGRRLHYREAGDPAAPLLVIMPGSTASSANHAGELRFFGRTRHVAALDYLGTGESDRLEPWPPDWWESGAAQADALAAHLGAERYALLGCSGGGTMALLAAADHPDRVTAVVADSCPERLSPADLRRLVDLRLDEASPRTGPGARDGSPAGGIADQPIPGSLVEYVWREGPRLLRRLVARPEQAFWKQAHGDDWAEVVAVRRRPADRARGPGWVGPSCRPPARHPLPGAPDVEPGRRDPAVRAAAPPAHGHGDRRLPALDHAPRRAPRHVDRQARLPQGGRPVPRRRLIPVACTPPAGSATSRRPPRPLPPRRRPGPRRRGGARLSPPRRRVVHWAPSRVRVRTARRGGEALLTGAAPQWRLGPR